MSTRGAERSAWVPWAEGLGLAAAVLAILVAGGDAVRASYHGYTHVAIGEAVLREGLTPENPYHAGAPLRYYTLYPLLGAMLGRIGMGPLWAFALLNGLAALLFAPALDALGRALGLSSGARRACFWAAVLGFNGIGWIGMALSSVDSIGLTPVYALAPMTFAREAFGWDPRLQAFLPKFLNVSSYALALPFGLWALARCASSERASARDVIGAGACAGLSLALNPLVGGLVGAWMAVWIAPTLVRSDLRARLTWLAAGALAITIALPFLLPATKPAPTGPELFGNPPLGGSPLTNWIGPILLLVVPGVIGLRSMSSAARWRWIVAAITAGALVFAGEMPQGNEYKMSRLSGLLWALPAGVCFARAIAAGGARRYATIALAALCVPTTFFVPRAYLSWGARAGALPLRVEHGRLAPDPAVVRPPLPDEILAAEAQADPESVIVLPVFSAATQGDTGLVQGNPLVPALHHALFVDAPQIHNEGQLDLGQRMFCTKALWTAPTPRARDSALAELRALLPSRPMIFLTSDFTPEVEAALKGARAAALAHAGDYTLWSLAALSAQ
jgi:hypothetical protein